MTENQAALDQLARSKCIAPPGHVLIKAGDARDMINQTAKELGVDLIVMG